MSSGGAHGGDHDNDDHDGLGADTDGHVDTDNASYGDENDADGLV